MKDYYLKQLKLGDICVMSQNSSIWGRPYELVKVLGFTTTKVKISSKRNINPNSLIKLTTKDLDVSLFLFANSLKDVGEEDGAL